MVERIMEYMEEEKYVDIMGKPLEVGKTVVYSMHPYANIMTGIIAKHTAKGIMIDHNNYPGGNAKIFKYCDEVAIVEEK